MNKISQADALYFNSCHVNISFTIETEQNNKISFLDVNVIREEGKFTTNVYQKPTFSGAYTYFDSFLPNTQEFGMISTLLNRYFRIFSNWAMSHSQLALLKEIFQKNGYPENFIIDVLDFHILKEKIPTLQEKLPYLEIIKLQTRTKL